MNGILLCLPVFLPIVAGLAAYFIPFRTDRARCALYAVIIGATTVLAWLAILQCDGSSFTFLRFTDSLHFTLRMDGAAKLFAGLSASLWPFTMVYAWDYMKHEGHKPMFWAFFTASFGVTLGIAFAANMMTMYLFYELLTLATIPLVMHAMTKQAIHAGVKYAAYSIAGAALATALSQLVSFCILAWLFLHGRSIVRVHLRCVSKRPGLYGEILLVGFPTICRQGFASLSSALLNNAAAVYSDAAVAAVTISNKIYLLVRSIVIGIGQGFQPVAGYNFGAGDKKRTRQAFWFSVLLGTAVCVVCAAVIALFPDEIMHFFRDDPEVTRIGRQALLYACAVMPVMAYSTYVNQLYQCLGFHQAATLLASCRNGLLYVPLILLLPRTLGLAGVEMSQPGADLLTFFVSLPFQIWFFRHKLR